MGSHLENILAPETLNRLVQYTRHWSDARGIPEGRREKSSWHWTEISLCHSSQLFFWLKAIWPIVVGETIFIIIITNYQTYLIECVACAQCHLGLVDMS